MRINNKRKKLLVFMLTIVLFMTIGFCAVSSSLNINTISSVNGNTWNVKFQNLLFNSNNNVTSTQTITNNTTVTFSVELSKPGDIYNLSVDIVNTGTIDAMLSSISKTSLTEEQENYIEYIVSYSDGVEIQEKDKLIKENGKETIAITVKFNEDYLNGDLPTTSVNLSLTLNYVQADSTAQDITHTDLHNFILKAKAGNATSSDIGRTFSVNLGRTYGVHTLRVANVSTPSECSGADFSQTACGVVLEFADIITTHFINRFSTNAGGWPATSMRTFVNNDIYYSLPTNLKNAILDTTVVSGHGKRSGETNFTSTDKLYLLSTHEVWKDEMMTIDEYDTAYNNTRQLDYYAGLGVTTTSYSDAIPEAIKYSGSTASNWALRTPRYTKTLSFLYVRSDGNYDYRVANFDFGVSPAFRIA